MKLFANGCSFTWGTGLSDIVSLFDHAHLDIFDDNNSDPENIKRIKYAWPTQLKNYIDFTEVYNYGAPCGSNQRIVRTTIDYFLKLISDGQDLTDYVAAIQFTEPSRWEYYDTEEKVWPLVKVGDISSCKEVDEGTYNIVQNTFLLSTPELDFANLTTSIITLGDFFEKHNIKYIFSSMAKAFDYIYHGFDNYKAMEQYCNQYNWFMGSVTESRMVSFPGWKPISPTDKHPNKDTHQLIGKLMAKDLLTLYPDLPQT